MAPRIATKTLAAIEEAIQADQGANFRLWLKQTMPQTHDAYSGSSFPFRSHMGASGIGKECERAIWYGFRWTKTPSFKGQLLRLFNRGHLEEGRFIAMLSMIGVTIYQHDAEGNQFRISAAGGHFGGSGDGVGVGIPDLDLSLPCLLEFKTAGLKPFEKLKKEGVRSAKFEHYVQVQTYMSKMKLTVCLYMAVNKNNDELYAEIIMLDTPTADAFIERGVKLVFMPDAPERLSESPGWFECKWCDFNTTCHFKAPPEVTCRSCSNAIISQDGTWVCGLTEKVLTRDEQLSACNHYSRGF